LINVPFLSTYPFQEKHKHDGHLSGVGWKETKKKKRTLVSSLHLPYYLHYKQQQQLHQHPPPPPNISFISISNHCACLPITSYLITHVVQRESRKEEKKEKEKEKVGKRKRSYDIRTLHACSRRKPKM
jgi:hypothetical protein